MVNAMKSTSHSLLLWSWHILDVPRATHLRSLGLWSYPVSMLVLPELWFNVFIPFFFSLLFFECQQLRLVSDKHLLAPSAWKADWKIFNDCL